MPRSLAQRPSSSSSVSSRSGHCVWARGLTRIITPVLAAFSDSFEKQTMGAAEIDLIKETLINTPAWYLALTVAVSLLHSLFEFLAFS